MAIEENRTLLTRFASAPIPCAFFSSTPHSSGSMSYTEMTNADVFALTRQRRAEGRLRARMALVAQHGQTRYYSFADFAKAMPPPLPPKPPKGHLSPRMAAIARSRQLRAQRCEKLLRAQSGLCYRCAKPFGPTLPVTLDHVMPRSAGGKDRGNLLLACGPCNNRKADTMPTARDSIILRLVNKALAMMG